MKPKSSSPPKLQKSAASLLPQAIGDTDSSQLFVVHEDEEFEEVVTEEKKT